MKIWIASLMAITLVSGCSTIPSSPEPQPEKYTFQIIGIEVPEEISNASQIDIEKIIKHPDADIAEYPIVIAGIGESVTNDQTRSVSFPEDYDIVDRKPVARERLIKLGYSVAITVDKIENGAVGYYLNASYRELAGFDEYPIGNGSKVKLPYFKVKATDTNVTHQPNLWISLGVLTGQRSDGNKMTHMTCVRVISPSVIQ